MSVMPWEMSWFPSLEVSIAFFAFLQLLLLVFVYCLRVTVAKAQEGRPRQRRRRGNKGNTRDFILLESLQPSRTQRPVHPDMDAVYEIEHQFNLILENLKRCTDTQNWETSEGSNNSWTSITASEVWSSSRVSLSPSREDAHSYIMASEASSSTEASLPPLSDDSWTSVTASDVGSSSRASLSTLVDEADTAHASTIQPGLERLRAQVEEQPETQGEKGKPSPSGQAPLLSKGAPQGQSGPVSERPTISNNDMGPPEQPLEKSVPMGEAGGQSSFSEDLGTPELPSEFTAPPGSSSLHTPRSSSEKTPAALPPPPDPIAISLQVPHREEHITALTDSYRANQAAEDLQNQLLALWQNQPPGNVAGPKTDPAAELPGALQSHGHRGAEKGEGSAQDRAGSRTLCPKRTKAPRHSLPGSEGSQTWAPSDPAAPGAGRERTVEERCPPEDGAKRQRGQKRAAAAQQSQRFHVCGSTVRIPLFRHGWLLPRCAPDRLVPP